MKEKSYYAALSKHYTQRSDSYSMAIEVKITKDNSIPFSCLQPHQESALLQSERALAHKIPDVGILKKPYDIILIRRAIAVVVVVFYKPRESVICEIGIREFIAEREGSPRKSLTLDRALLICRRVIEL